MEIWGVQIPTDYAILGGSILIAALITLTGWALRRFVRGRTEADLARDVHNNTIDWMRRGDLMLTLQDDVEKGGEDAAAKAEEITRTLIEQDSSLRLLFANDVRRRRRTSLVLSVLNFASTVFALVPIVGAIVAILSSNSALALRLDVLGLIVLIVTKGGLWLLTMALIPMLKAIPVGVGTGMASYYTQRWLKSREKDRELVEKR